MHQSNGWHVSSASSGAGQCVEAALDDRGDEEAVVVRHSKHPEGPTIRYTLAEWNAFLIGVRNGEFEVGVLTAQPGQFVGAALEGNQQ